MAKQPKQLCFWKSKSYDDILKTRKRDAILDVVIKYGGWLHLVEEYPSSHVALIDGEEYDYSIARGDNDSMIIPNDSIYLGIGTICKRGSTHD